MLNEQFPISVSFENKYKSSNEVLQDNYVVTLMDNIERGNIKQHKSIRDLSLDIQKNGLTHPILILNDEVIYGMQRSVIAKHLHFTHLSCYYCKDKEQLEKIHKEQNEK